MVATPFGEVPSFIFGGNTGIPSYAELQRRRAIQEARARGGAGRAYPKTLGEGIAALGEGIGDRLENQRLAAGERGFETAEDARLSAVRAAPGVGAGPGRVSDADPSGVKDRLAAYYAGGSGGAAPNPTVAAGASSPQEPIQAAGGLPAEYAAGISGIEADKRGYRTLGAVTPKGDRAHGLYGIMGANVPEWTQAALGKAMTPAQFLADDKAQDAVFQHRFGDYVNKYGPEGAARAWYGGEKGMKNLGATDMHRRLTVGGYGQDFMRRLQGARGAPSGAPEDTLDSAGETVTHIPGADDENPPTPSTIRPAPAAVSGAPVIAPAPPAVSGRPAADTLPSMTPVPPQVEQTMKEPGPEPKPPTRIDFSPRQQMALDVMNSRNVSDYAKAFAKQQFEIEEKIRTELTARRETDYTHNRARWEKDKDAYDKFTRETHDRNIDQLIKRGQIEKAQAEQEKLYYERGIPRAQAEQKAALDIQQKQQEIQAGKAPPHVTVDDKLMIWDQATNSFKPMPPPPKGEGRPDIKLNESQSKTFGNLQTADIGFEQYKRIPDVDRVLAEGLRDELAGKIPFFSNAALTNRYRRARNAALQVADAQLREISGASIGVAEEAKAIARLFPVYGDDPGTTKQKAEIREGIVTGMRLKLGRAGDLADYARAERQKVDAAEQAKIDAEMKDAPKVVGKIYVDGKKRRFWTGSRWEDD